VPHVMAAVVILLLTWYLSRFAAGLVSSLLENAGVDSIAQKMGLKQVSSGSARPSRLASGLLVFFAMLFAVSEAADQLGFSQVRGLTAGFIMFAGDIVLGSAILAVGFWLANRAYDALQKSDGQTGSPLAGVARIAILGLLLGMGLRAMGIANDIVQLAFGLTLGAVAVAVAISFGLGGREAAAKLMEHWLSKWRRD
jgi:Conserved TM helix